jgi:hypothetical protein
MPNSDEPTPKPRPQIDLDQDDQTKPTVESLQKENLSLRELVVRLSEIVIRNITRKKK